MGKIIVSSSFSKEHVHDIAMRELYNVCEEKNVNFDMINKKLSEQKTAIDFVNIYNNIFEDNLKIII